MAHPPVLILGGGLTVLGVLRLLGRRGVEAFVWPPAADFARHSRWYHAAPPTGVDPEQDLAGYLRALPFEQAVLVPASDTWAVAVASLDPALAARFPASVPTVEVLRTLVDKRAFAELLGVTEIGHPFTRPVDGPADLARVPDDVMTRAFLKPRDSQRFFSRFGVKGWRVTSRDEASARVAELAEEGIGVVIQEYVPGAASEHYFVDGFADRGSRLRSAFGRRRLRMYPLDFGNSTCMVSVPPSEVAEGVAGMERLVAHLGYRGIFSAEFKRDARDGRLKLLEVNARPWWYVEFTGRCGVDVMAQYYDDALGRPVRDMFTYHEGRALVYPYYDYHAMCAAGVFGPARIAVWAARALRSIQPVWTLDDPRPALAGVASVVGRRLARGGRRGS